MAPISTLEPEQAPSFDTLSCVFTDVVDSTSLWEHDPAAMHIALTLHNRLIRHQLQYLGGYEVKTLGDGFFIVFESALDALHFSLEVQKALSKMEWPAGILDHVPSRLHGKVHRDEVRSGLRIRIGLHWGTPHHAGVSPISRRVDYFGPVINKAARIESEARGDNISMSDAFIEQLCLEQSRSDLFQAPGLPFDDDTRYFILQKEVPSHDFEIQFKGYCTLKGIAAPEYISLICIKCPGVALTRPATPVPRWYITQCDKLDRGQGSEKVLLLPSEILVA